MCSATVLMNIENSTIELNSFVERYTNEFGRICKEYVGNYIVIYENHYDTIGDLSDIKNPLDVRELYIDGLVIKGRNVFHVFKNLEHLHGVPVIKSTSLCEMFMYFSKLRSINDIGKWDMSNIKNMSCMFRECKSLTGVGDLGGWDTSNVTDMNHMFYLCESLKDVSDLGRWDIRSCTDMRSMFHGCESLKNVGDLGGWYTSKVTDMCFMFWGCKSLTSIGDLGGWDTSQITNMSWN